MIYFDAASIHAAVLKVHPEISPHRSSCHINRSNSGPFAWVTDWTNVRDRVPLMVGRDDERYDYHGFQIGIFRYTEQGEPLGDNSSPRKRECMQVMEEVQANIIREDGRLERVCTHGCGHPVGHMRGFLLGFETIHGCCGCCSGWLTQKVYKNNDR